MNEIKMEGTNASSYVADQKVVWVETIGPYAGAIVEVRNQWRKSTINCSICELMDHILLVALRPTLKPKINFVESAGA